MSSRTSSINSSSSSSSRGSAERSESNDGNKEERKSVGSSQTSRSKSSSSSQSHGKTSELKSVKSLEDNKSGNGAEESKLNFNIEVNTGQNQVSICIVLVNHQKEQEDTCKEDTENKVRKQFLISIKLSILRKYL